MTGPLAGRTAAAPISWGVCEVPGWGHQMSQDRVLGEMRELGVTAAEFGPPGFLPADPRRRAEALGGHGLQAVGGFLALVLHDAAADPVPRLEAELAGFATSGADTVVLAAATGAVGYEGGKELTADQWRTLLVNLDAVAARAAAHGLRPSLHPHVGTVIEGPAEIARVLEESTVPLCLDTGHLLAGGTDPVHLARDATARIGHVHLKDVHGQLLERMRSGSIGYAEAVAEGLYAPLGDGDVDVAAIVAVLEAADYQGWYVMEQDRVLDAEPPDGQGPRADVAASMAYLDTVVAGAPDDR